MMRRLIGILVLALTALPIAVPTTSQACAPGDTPAYWIASVPGVQDQQEASLSGTQEIDGYYVGAGQNWKLTITRGTTTIVYSTAKGSLPVGPKGTIKVGDRVTGYVSGASTLLFGNVGCV